MNYVIIGNSAAGIGAIEAIRKVDTSSPIVLLSEENCLAYSRPLIAEYISNSIDLDKMWYRTKSFYTQNNVDLRLNTKVVKVDPQNQTVTTENNQTINFDKLLIATGGTPFIPPIKGSDHKKVYTFVRWDEVKRIEADKDSIKDVVVLGGGLIGSKAAEHLSKIGMNVTMVELADTILNLIIDKTSATLVQKHFNEHGVKIINNNTIKEVVSSGDKVTEVILNDDTKIPCDAVIIAIGVVPNKSLIEGTDIKQNKGILVNEFLETNYPNIYAAGDVAEGYDLLLQDKRVLPIWPLAYKQGKIAGMNMAGVKKVYDGGISMNSLEFFHLPIISAGYTTMPDASYEEEYIINMKKKVYKKIILKNNKLEGFIFINNINRAGILTGLIKEQVDISDFKKEILKDSFGLIYLPIEIREKKIEAAIRPQN